MKDVGYGGKRAGAPAVSKPVDVPIMAAAAAGAPTPAAVKKNTPSQPQFETADIVRHRRPRSESRRAPTKKPKPSPLPNPLH